MKKIISALLATVMLLSTMPMMGFAEEENAPNESATETNVSQEEMPGFGTEASVGDIMFYIEDGSLLRSQNNARPQTVDTDVSWVIAKDGKIYWSKLDEHNTSTVYFCNVSETSGEALKKVFVPIEAFDISDEELYYLYNGEIVKVNTQTGKEYSVGMFDCDAFYLKDGTIECISYPENTALLTENELNAYECQGNDMVSIAQSQYGYHEGYNNDNKYAVELKNAGYPAANNQAWCAYFASWCAMKAGVLGKDLSFSSVATPSDFGVKDYSLKQCFNGEYTPKYGDLIFYGSTPTGNKYGSFPYHGNHVGIVTKDGVFSNGRLLVSTIEGNFNDKVDTRDRNVGNNGYVSSNYYIIGFGCVGNTKKSSISNGNVTKPSSPSKPSVPKTDTSIKVNITDCPSDNFVAKSYTLRGSISSNYPITWVTAWLKNTTTGETISYYNAGWNSKRINLAGSAIDRAIRFDQCVTPGTYELAVGAANAHVSGIYDKKYFTVKGADLKQPQFSVSSIEEGQRVSITSPDGGYVRYNLNGDYGGEGSSITRDLTTPGTYNFYAWETKSGYNDSPAITRSISVQKVGTPSISDVKYGANSAWVTISGDGDIHYTMNGSNPSKNSSSYNGTIYLYDSTTIKAMTSRYGQVNSDVASKYLSVAAPDAPTGLKLYNTKQKIAQGKTATVRWNAMDRATGYEARLYLNGEQVGRAYETNGTTAAFKLSDVGTYTIKVKAKNFKGSSAECDGITVESMAPVTVKFVDRILREGKVTDDVVNQIQQNVRDHGEDTEIEGNVISVQKIDYDTKPNLPAWEDKKGFSRQYFDGAAYTNILEDTTVYAYYSVRSYNVSFWNFWTGDSTHNSQLGSTQNIMYSYSAEAPTDFDMPTGYTLAGWNVDTKVSDGYDFTFVDGNIKLSTVYAWENKDLPVVLEVLGAKRGNTCQSYDITLRYINNNLTDTQARLIVSLYTADGRMVYTTTEDIDLMKRDPGKYYTENIQATYIDKVSKITAVMVQVKNDLTGGAVSKMAETTNIETPNDGTYWEKWSDWSTTQPSEQPAYKNDVKGNAREIQQKTQYRYRNKAYTQSGSSSLWGWNLYNTQRTSWSSTVGPVYYDPSGWSRNVWSERYVTSSNYKTVYHYYRYANSWSGGYGAATAKYPNYYTYDFDYELPRYTGNYGYKWYWGGGSGDWNTVWRADYLGNAYTTRQWVSDNYSTRWYYQDPVYTYYYWKWNDWSAWSDSPVSGDETETRTVYSYRDNHSYYPGYDPNRDSSLEQETKEKYELSGNIAGLSKDYNGKLATVLIYKKTNTDPTQEQLEYVDQITLGENNSYSFTVNPKEELSYDNTGDFVVTLSIEGCDRLANVDVIKAPAPQCTVTFQNDDGSVLKDADGNELKIAVDKGGSIDAYDVPIPHKDGYRFVKWDTSLVNIDSDMTVSPLFEREAYNVVFVDYENQTADMVEVKYGDPIVLPEVEPIEGKEFIGWDAECYKYATEGDIDTDIFNIKEETPYYLLTDGSYILTTEYDSAKHNIVDETEYYKYFSEKNTTITESKIVSAKWKSLEYTVKFCDFDGNVVAGDLGEQKVKYGESAQPPASLEKNGVMCPWDLTGGEWWNVKQDMTITPYIPQTVQVDAPTISAPTTDAYGEYKAELETSAEDSKIYYTLDCGITESDVRKFVEMQKASDVDNSEESESAELNSVSLMSADAETTTEEPTEVDGSDEYNENAIDYIEEYTEPISLYAGNIVYAFTVDKDGNISTISVFQYDYNADDDMLGDASNEYVPDSDVPQITMATINAKPGETVTVPVKIKNNMGITNLSMILGYDADDLTLDSAENGDVFADSEFASDIRDDGSCKFTWKTKSDNSNDGTLMNLTFTVKDTADKSKYMLDLRVDYSGDENDEEWYFVTVPGALTGEEKIDGTLGDVNGDGDVDFADAILTLKYDAGLKELEENQLLLGDVNGDGDVDFSDAILIIKYDAGLISEFKK